MCPWGVLLTVEILAVDGLAEHHARRWGDWVGASSGLDSPFLTPEFARAVSRIRPGCCVAVYHDDDGVSGYLPFERVGARRARTIGFGLSDSQGIVPRPGTTGLTIEPLLAAASLDVFAFDHLAAAQVVPRSPHVSRVGSPMLDLSNGYQAYRDDRRGLTNSAIKRIERKDRKLARERGTVHLAYDTTDDQALELMMTWKSGHYRRTGAPDLFTDASVRDLVHECARARGDRYAGVLSVLYAGDATVAIEFGLRSRTLYERWFAGYDPELAEYSPGLVGILRLAAAMSEDGIRAIDLGKGNESYKDFFASYEVPLADGWVTGRRSPSALLFGARHIPPRAGRAYLKAHPRLRARYRATANAVNRVRRYGLAPSAGDSA